MGSRIIPQVRESITLEGAPLAAAEELIFMKVEFARKRAEILAKYRLEMAEFAASQQTRVNACFKVIYNGTDTREEDGWEVTGDPATGDITLEPVISNDLVEAMIERGPYVARAMN